MNKKYDTLCLFTSEGHTFTFRNVELVINNETTLVFLYRAVSEHGAIRKRATVIKANLAAWSVTPWSLPPDK
jgi:hypothetical protein